MILIQSVSRLERYTFSILGTSVADAMCLVLGVPLAGLILISLRVDKVVTKPI